MLAAALLSQNVPLWHPCDEDIERWFRAALALQASTVAMDYDPSTPREVYLSRANNDQPFQVCAALLRNVRSFQGDMNMLDDIAKHGGGKRISCPGLRTASGQWGESGAAEVVTPMPFPEHCIDQHTHPNIAFL